MTTQTDRTTSLNTLIHQVEIVQCAADGQTNLIPVMTLEDSGYAIDVQMTLIITTAHGTTRMTMKRPQKRRQREERTNSQKQNLFLMLH